MLLPCGRDVVPSAVTNLYFCKFKVKTGFGRDVVPSAVTYLKFLYDKGFLEGGIWGKGNRVSIPPSARRNGLRGLYPAGAGCLTAPSLLLVPRKVTLAPAARLQARSRRLRCATNFSRVPPSNPFLFGLTGAV